MFFALVCSFNLKLNLTVLTLSCCPTVPVRRDVQENDEEAVRVKEQSILELGTLLAKTGQAAGKMSLCDAHTLPDSQKSLFATCFCVSLELGGLLKFVRPFLISISKAKAARLVRSLLDLFLDMEAATGQEVGLCLECIEWAKAEKRTFLRQALEVSEPWTRRDSLLNKGDAGSDKVPRSSY